MKRVCLCASVGINATDKLCLSYATAELIVVAASSLISTAFIAAQWGGIADVTLRISVLHQALLIMYTMVQKRKPLPNYK